MTLTILRVVTTLEDFDFSSLRIYSYGKVNYYKVSKELISGDRQKRYVFLIVFSNLSIQNKALEADDIIKLFNENVSVLSVSNPKFRKNLSSMEQTLLVEEITVKDSSVTVNAGEVKTVKYPKFEWIYS